MPTVTIDLMTEDEKQELSQHLTEIMLACSDGYCRMEVRAREDGSLYIDSSTTASGGRAVNLDRSLRAVQEALDAGKAGLTEIDGRSMLGPATVTRTHHYPMARMTPEEEAEFDGAMETVNRGMRSGTCRFESFLDEYAHVYFRYSVDDNAPERVEIFRAIALIVVSVHSGRAVHTEMPGGGVMLMPRWPAAAG